MKYSIQSVEKGRGVLEVTVDDVLLTLGSREEKIKKAHVTNVLKKGDCALNKVDVQLDYYDALGYQESKSFLMYANEFKALKNALGK